MLSYSPVIRDPRVLRQVKWLAEAEDHPLEVNVFGLQAFPNFPYGTYTELQLQKLPTRLKSYLFYSPKDRQAMAVKTFLDSGEVSRIRSGDYSLVILNDLDFVGVDDIFNASIYSKTPIFIDLHEFFYDFGGSPIYRLLHTRYYNWLLKKLQTRVVTGIFTVSEAIADLYKSKLSLKPVAVMNIPERSKDQEEEPRDEIGKRINLLYHGAAGKGRGVYRVIRAMKHVRKEFQLNLILMGSKSQINRYKLFAFLNGNRSRVAFHRPVDFSSITQVLQNFDIQVIFYHPPHSTNERFALPNKFFESARAGQALIVGDSPSMKAIVQEFNAGWVVPGWTHVQLAETINSITPQELRNRKRNAIRLSDTLTSDTQRETFLHSLGIKK